MLAACAVGPDFVRPAPPDTDRYTREPQPAATVAAGWSGAAFHSGAALLSRLVATVQVRAARRRGPQALANNPTLQAAEASLRQSQDNLRAGYGVFYPQVDAGIGSRERAAPRCSRACIRRTLGLQSGHPERHCQLRARRVRRRAPAVEGLRAQVDYQRSTEQGGLPDPVRQRRQHEHRARGLCGPDSRDRTADRAGARATASAPRPRCAPAPSPTRMC
jgi:hypothetical protein